MQLMQLMRLLFGSNEENIVKNIAQLKMPIYDLTVKITEALEKAVPQGFAENILLGDFFSPQICDLIRELRETKAIGRTLGSDEAKAAAELWKLSFQLSQKPLIPLKCIENTDYIVRHKVLATIKNMASRMSQSEKKTLFRSLKFFRFLTISHEKTKVTYSNLLDVLCQILRLPNDCPDDRRRIIRGFLTYYIDRSNDCDFRTALGFGKGCKSAVETADIT